MKWKSKSRYIGVAIILALVTALSVQLALIVSGAMADPQKQAPAPPPERASPPEERRQAELKAREEFWAKQPQFQQEFITSGRDLHSLPIVEIAGQDFGLPTLDETLRHSKAVIRGQVVDQWFQEGLVISQLSVQEWLYGEGGLATVLIAQPGGPLLNGDTPVLVQLREDPILWKGREYILFLTDSINPSAVSYYAVAGSGRQFEINADSVQPVLDTGWAATMAGLSVAEFKNRVMQASNRETP